MSSPVWKPDNLKAHHEKRVREDSECWEDILSIEREITQSEYEKESYEAFENGVFEYEAKELKGGEGGKWHKLRLYRIDKRTVLVITNLDKSEMITCFHSHISGKHKRGDPGRSLVENVLEHQVRIARRAEGGLTKLHRVELRKSKIKKSRHRSKGSPLVLQTEKLKKYYVQKTEADAVN